MTIAKIRRAIRFLLTAGFGFFAANAQVLPHIAVGGSFTTEFLVINSASAPGTLTLEFFDDAGKPMALNFPSLGTSASSLVTKSPLPPGGSIFIEASNPGGPTRSGSAKITASAGMSVSAIFRSKAADGKYYESSEAPTSGSTRFTMAFDATTTSPAGDQIHMGIAMVNADLANPSTITCTATDMSGAVVPKAILVPTLAPGGHWATDQFPALAGRRGSLDCSASTRVGAIGLRFLGANALSSLTVVESAAASVPRRSTADPAWLPGTWVDSAGNTLTFYSDGKVDSAVASVGLRLRPRKGTYQVSQNAVTANWSDGEQVSYSVFPTGGATSLFFSTSSIFHRQ